MNTHALAAHLRNSRRPSHLGFSGEGLLNTVVDYGQEHGGDYIEEKVTEVTGSDTAGQIARTGFDAGVDSAQGQTQTPSAGTNTNFYYTSLSPSITKVPYIKNIRAYQGLTPDRLKALQAAMKSPGLLQPTETIEQQLILDEDPLAENTEDLTGEGTESAEGSGKNKALIIGGSILALVLIGGGVYFATRK